MQETLVGKHIGYQAICMGCDWEGDEHRFGETVNVEEAMNRATGDFLRHHKGSPAIPVITDIGGTGGYVYHEVRIEKLRE